jgi:dihydroorotase-like cyclic amidohydrolase
MTGLGLPTKGCAGRPAEGFMTADCVIRNGKLVITKYWVLEADIAISNEKIVQIGLGIGEGRNELDARGQHVFPGCVDIHMHYGHFNEFYDEMATESKCITSLGTTTAVVLLDRCIKNMEGWKDQIHNPELFLHEPEMLHYMWRASYKKLFPEVIEKSEQRSANDFAFHLLMENEDQIREIPEYYREYGISSFKFWTGLEGGAALAADEMWMLLDMCRREGVVPYANTVNQRLWRQITREVEERAKTDPRLAGPWGRKEAFPGIVETLDLEQVLAIASEIGVPELLIAHVTYRDSVKMIRRYRTELGLNVHGETCAAWLTLTWPEIGEKYGHRATCIIPHLGYKEDADALWEGIEAGDITCIGTDGVISPRQTYPDGKPNPYYRPEPTYEREGLGFPSQNCMFPVVLHEGLERGLSPVRIAEVCAYHPAQAMRLYPRKGTIAVGSDADLVFVDTSKEHVVTRDELHTASPFTPWEGWKLRCWPTLTMLRGTVVCENGQFLAERTGRYLPRFPH